MKNKAKKNSFHENELQITSIPKMRINIAEIVCSHIDTAPSTTPHDLGNEQKYVKD